MVRLFNKLCRAVFLLPGVHSPVYAFRLFDAAVFERVLLFLNLRGDPGVNS